MISPEQHKRDLERVDALLRDKALAEGALIEWNKRLVEFSVTTPHEARAKRDEILKNRDAALEDYRKLQEELDTLEKKRDLG